MDFPVDGSGGHVPTAGMSGTLKRLESTIKERRVSDPALSYVAKLRVAGRAKMAQKLGEEAVETVIAAVSDDSRAVTSEAADLMFPLDRKRVGSGKGCAVLG